MKFTIFGQIYRQGSYILLIVLRKPVSVAFGKFLDGRPINLAPGHYLYVGSALGSRRGAFPLASRVLRHASRSDCSPPHEIRTALLNLFTSWSNRPPARKTGKKLHWHIDYLLDRPEAEIIHVMLFPSPVRLEPHLADLLDSMPETSPVANRLGAQDASTGTHLFRITDPAALHACLEGAWEKLKSHS